MIVEHMHIFNRILDTYKERKQINFSQLLDFGPRLATPPPACCWEAVALGVQMPVDLHSAAPTLGSGAVLARGPAVTVVSAPKQVHDFIPNVECSQIRHVSNFTHKSLHL